MKMELAIFMHHPVCEHTLQVLLQINIHCNLVIMLIVTALIWS